MPKVKFVKEEVEIEVPEGANLRKEALRANIGIYRGMDRFLNCRGLALCGTCAVAVQDGRGNCANPGIRERIRLLLSYLPIGRAEGEIRLACQTRILGDVAVETGPEVRRV